MLLEPIYEQDFLDCSYGFRPRRSAHQALASFRDQAMTGRPKGGWVLEVDIRKFFDNLDHRHLRQFLRLRVRDGVLLRLIDKWLKAGVMEDGNVSHPDSGTPQGGVVSPLLSNVFLHYVLDQWFEQDVKPRMRGRAFLVRYADDFVILARRQGRRLIDWTESLLEGRFKLTINREKTKVVDLKELGASLDFLSFTFRYDRDLKGRSHRYLNVFPSEKALAHARRRLRDLTGKQQCMLPIPDILGLVNRWLRGWSFYFRHGYPRMAFREINWFTCQRLMRHLQRRSQRPFRAPEGVSFYAYLQAMGLRLL